MRYSADLVIPFSSITAVGSERASVFATLAIMRLSRRFAREIVRSLHLQSEQHGLTTLLADGAALVRLCRSFSWCQIEHVPDYRISLTARRSWINRAAGWVSRSPVAMQAYRTMDEQYLKKHLARAAKDELARGQLYAPLSCVKLGVGTAALGYLRSATTTAAIAEPAQIQASVEPDLNVFWINRPNDITRRRAMEEELRKFGNEIQHFRRNGVELDAVVKMLEQHTVEIGPDFHVCGREVSSTQPQPTPVSLSAIGQTFMHVRAIKAAYDLGLERAIILEDDVRFRDRTADELKLSVLHALANAPPGWRILQLHVSDVSVLRRLCTHIRSPYVKWERGHSSAGAYLINRYGMRSVLDQTNSFTNQVRLQQRVLVEDVLFRIGDVYTYTRPLFLSTSSNASRYARSSRPGSATVVADSGEADVSSTDGGSCLPVQSAGLAKQCAPSAIR